MRHLFPGLTCLLVARIVRKSQSVAVFFDFYVNEGVKLLRFRIVINNIYLFHVKRFVLSTHRVKSSVYGNRVLFYKVLLKLTNNGFLKVLVIHG